MLNNTSRFSDGQTASKWCKMYKKENAGKGCLQAMTCFSLHLSDKPFTSPRDSRTTSPSTWCWTASFSRMCWISSTGVAFTVLRRISATTLPFLKITKILETQQVSICFYWLKESVTWVSLMAVLVEEPCGQKPI